MYIQMETRFAHEISIVRHPDADVFRRLEQRLPIGRVTPTARVNAGRSRIVQTPPKEDKGTCTCGTKTVEELTRYRTRIGTAPAEGLRRTS